MQMNRRLLMGILTLLLLLQLLRCFLLRQDTIGLQSIETRIRPVQACQEKLKDVLPKKLHPRQINQLRRTLALNSAVCYEQNFDFFANAFIARLSLQHLNLHIPKTGGTTLCHLVQESNHTTHPEANNCWYGPFCPIWCCCSFNRRPVGSCDQQLELQRGTSFTMNENWLDHPLCDEVLYSISLRDPTARSISHVNHLLLFPSFATDETRLRIIESNYMTWSLVAGTSPAPKSFVPNTTKDARDVLSQFDFILDLAAVPEDCKHLIFEFMGLPTETATNFRVSGNSNYSQNFDQELYRDMNQLDQELYNYALDLIRIDCQFFGQVKDKIDQGFLYQNQN